MHIEIKRMQLKEHESIMAFFTLGMFETEEHELPFSVVEECRLMKGKDGKDPWVAFPARQDSRGGWITIFKCPDSVAYSQIVSAALIEYQTFSASQKKQPQKSRPEKQIEQETEDDEDIPF
jgi:DNA-binding cell septation regulator SpoVG